MSNVRSFTILVVAGALLCVASTETVWGPARAEVRPATNIEKARSAQLRCRLYFGCAPLARADANATGSESE